MNQKIKDLKIQCDLYYNASGFLVQRANIVDMLDYIERLQNLVTAQNALIDQAELGVKCNGCPFIDTCIFEEGKVSDCQIRMANQGKELNHVL